MANIDFTEQYAHLQKKVILNVDDNEMNQLVISKIMDNAGVKTVKAENGLVALNLLKEGMEPDVILLDLEMPVMNGMQTAEAIKREFNKQIPVIINTGSVTAYEIWKLKKLGIKEFLEKPYNMKDIFTKISKSLVLFKENFH